jgi:cytochrome c5
MAGNLQLGSEDGMSDTKHPAPGAGADDGSHPGSQEDAHEEGHTGPIKTPKQLIATVVASFAIPIAGIVLLVNYVDFGAKPAAGSNALGDEAVALRVQPVATVKVREVAAPGAVRTGEQVYQGQCSACHAIGAAGSPKFGDVAAWAPRIKTGYEALLNSALKGKNAMTAQGGGEYSNLEVGRAVVYMANQGGANFPVPQPPAAAASAP